MADIVISGNTSGSVTLRAPDTSGSTVLTLPTTTGTLVVTGGAQTVQFAAGSAASPSITFTGDTNTGIFSPTADTIAFSEGGVESMRIDSSGNVLVGKTTSSDNTVGTLIAPTYLFVTRDGFAPLNLRRLTSSGNIAEFYSGTSGTSSGAISVASTGMTYTGTNGITFTATQTASADANTLDDYEEGTWTPTVRGSSTSGTYTPSSVRAYYTKIGNQVTCWGGFGFSAASGGSGIIIIEGFPFSYKSSSAINASLNTIYLNTSASSSNGVNISNTTSASATTFYVFLNIDNSVQEEVAIGAISTSTQLYFTLTYTVS